ncbi:hypothetical protein G9A89_008920 [Geosiphon pyriformis]|nr:hypothetical protein G9A89_008920 [Geosiphon pyriformis]
MPYIQRQTLTSIKASEQKLLEKSNEKILASSIDNFLWEIRLKYGLTKLMEKVDQTQCIYEFLNVNEYSHQQVFSFLSREENKDYRIFLGCFYQHGIGTIADCEKARFHFGQSVEAGDKLGPIFLRNCLESEEFADPTNTKKQTILSLEKKDLSVYEEANKDNFFIYGVTQIFTKSLERSEKGFLEKAIRLFLKNINLTPEMAFKILLNNPNISNHRCLLGDFHKFGIGIVPDLNMAFREYMIAAQAGNPFAQAIIGNCFLNGDGCSRHESQAFFWLALSVQGGSNWGKWGLGRCYAKGFGVTKDEQKGLEWYIKSAESGMALSQWKLGRCYETGSGVEKDNNKAFYWYQKSAETGNAIAIYHLAKCYQKGRSVEKDPSMAFSLYKRAAEEENPAAQRRLAYCYERGYGTTQDLQLALECYKESAKNGDAVGQYHLANFYRKGGEIPVDGVKAFYWYRKSSRIDEHGQKRLGSCYEHGVGISRDVHEALWLYYKAHTNGCKHACDGVFGLFRLRF